MSSDGRQSQEEIKISNSIKTKMDNAKDKVVITYLTIKKDVCEATIKALDWVKNNPESAMTIMATGIGVVWKGTKMISRYNDDHRHDKEVYDPRLQMWHPVRRKLKYDEELYYKTSVQNGRNAVDVLREMRLYK